MSIRIGGGRFPGGLVLPPNKARSTAGPIRTLPLPATLVVPLRQHAGEPSQPCVAVGERVRAGQRIADARGERSMAEVAAVAGISAETLRKIETGRAPTPAFFTIAALAGALGLSLDEVAAACALDERTVAAA